MGRDDADEELTHLRDRLRQHVHVLAGLIGVRNTRRPSALEATLTYLRRELTAAGHAVVEQPYEVSLRSARNLEVTIEGTRPGLPELVVGAHYDTAFGTPGADDNASAVAALLEIARGVTGARFRRTVRLVFYDTEEMPHFGFGEMGSQFHAAACHKAGRRLMGMICLESIGYFGPPDPQVRHWSRAILRPLGTKHVVAIADFRSALFLARVAWALLLGGWWRTVALAMPKRVEVIHLSDHRGYWEQGYRALMLTDTAFLRNPNYHQPTDTPDTLDYELLARLTRALIRAVRRLAR